MLWKTKDKSIMKLAYFCEFNLNLQINFLIKSMKKSAYFLFCLFILLALVFSINCGVQVKTGNPPASETEVKQASENLSVPPFPTSINSSTVADYNWSVTDLKGKTTKVAEWKNKVILLNMWATWCGPCVAELPSLQKLYEKTKDQNIVIALVSNEDQETVNEFIKKKNFSLPVYTTAQELPEVFTSYAIPKTFIISPNGKIVFDHLGGAKWDDDASVKFLNQVAQLK
jgi:thiol-disulfide isomerase/thioredoxin